MLYKSLWFHEIAPITNPNKEMFLWGCNDNHCLRVKSNASIISKVS